MPLVTIRDRNSNATQFQVEVAFDNCAPYQVDFANPYDEYQEQLFAWYFEGWLYNPHLDTVRAAEAANLLQNYGKKLFVDVIQSNPEVYQQYVYLRKDLSQVQIEIEGNSPEFQALHWEAIQDPELPTPLGVECVILRKAARPAVTPVSIKTYPTINLLIVTARPDQENDAAYRTISRPLIQAIRNAELKVKIDLLRPGTYEALSRQLEAKGNGYYHIVHFDTHGALLEYEQLTSERVKSRFIYGDRFGRKDLKPYEGVEAFIFLEGQTKGKADPVKAEELAGLLTNRGIPLCILNACQSGQQLLRITAALEEIDSRETSLGSRLMVAGMELVVAMGYSVTVTAAEIMMEQLYTNLFQDSDFQRAIRLGRKELWNRKSRRAQYNQSIDLEDWILPVVYANGTLDLNLRDFTPDEEEEYWDSVASQYQFIPPPSDFIGRDLDILLIEQALIKHNILLLRGMGGTGKTTLLSYLREWWQITNFAQEIFYFGYDERAWNLEQIVLEIAKQLYPGKYDYFNFQAMKPPARASKLKSKLRAESHIIILDNLESVTGQPLAIQNTLDTPEQKLIKQFLTQLAGGKTKIILGSRSGETWLQPTTFKENIYQLGGLDPEARTLLAEKILERVAPTRKTSIRENGDFKRLMNLLAGYPLAMEVVLSNLKQQTAAEIINQLDAADIQSLGGADKTNNIVKCIEYSHSNLSPQAQELLLCLAPFRKFIDTSDIPNYVKQLQQFEPFRDYQPETLASAIEEATNWGLLSPINPDYPSLLTIQPVLPYFLQTKLKETDTREALRQAFNQHYQGLGNLYFQYMQSKEAEKRQIGITFVRLEYENLYQGLQINLEQQTSPYAIWQCLYKYLDLTSNYPQQLQFTEAVYDALEAYPPEKRNATWEEHIVPISGNLANSYLRNQDYDRAHKTYQQALTQIAQLQNIEENQKQSYQATIYHQIGMVAQELREYDQAQQYYRQALNLKIKSGDRFALATTFHQLGRVTQKLREYNLAIAYYQEALNLKIEYGDRFSQATTFHQLGKVAEELREYNSSHVPDYILRLSISILNMAIAIIKLILFIS
ncbi:MAG: tetratricopeptide repeat protein [Cyanobacteria bacterium J06558_2]